MLELRAGGGQEQLGTGVGDLVGASLSGGTYKPKDQLCPRQ